MIPTPSVYTIVTKRVLECLEKGTVPWRQPWSESVGGYPRSLVTGKEYRGINVFLLATARYTDPRWITFKQTQAHGYQVRKGEKGMPVVYWQKGWIRKTTTAEGDEEEYCDGMFLRYYIVFNASQVAGVAPLQTKARAFEPIPMCETVVSGIKGGPEIEHGATGAWYRPATDTVSMPDKSFFDRPEDYYSVLFHELTHASGHESRLDRKGIAKVQPFGTPDYSREELVAEMGAAFLCGHAGISTYTVDDSAAYLSHWIKQLRGDARLVVTAAAQAQKAADWVLGREWGDTA